MSQEKKFRNQKIEESVKSLNVYQMLWIVDVLKRNCLVQATTRDMNCCLFINFELTTKQETEYFVF